MLTLYTSDGYSYTGMSQDTVTLLRTALGRSTVFVDEATYLDYLAAHQPTH